MTKIATATIATAKTFLKCGTGKVATGPDPDEHPQDAADDEVQRRIDRNIAPCPRDATRLPKR